MSNDKTIKLQPQKFTGSTAPIVISAAKKTIFFSNGTVPITGNWSSSTTSWSNAWFSMPEPEHAYDSADGFVERVRKELEGRHAKPTGILMHALTLHALTQAYLGEDTFTPTEGGGYLFGLVIKTSWDMPEWEWVFSDRSKPVSIKNTAVDNQLRTFFDSKSASIKARGR